MVNSQMVISALRKQAGSLRDQAEQIVEVIQEVDAELDKVATTLDGEHVRNFLNFYGRLTR